MAQQWGPWKNRGDLPVSGQADVFKVENASTQQVGALKRLKNIKRLARFEREIRASSSLDHPHIARLMDADINATKPYAVFEYISGGTIGEIDKDELLAIPINIRFDWCEQLCEALIHAHSKGVVHRDIKPANILLNDLKTSVVLCDFGLAFVDDDNRFTETLEQAGSKFYLAPECEDGPAETISPATDLYSLGKAIYYIFSGRTFSREKHREEKFELSKVLHEPFFEHVSVLLDKLIQHTPSDRYQSAAEVLAAVKSARRLLELRAPCVGKPDTHLCIFCRQGRYVVVAQSRDNWQMGYADEGIDGNQEDFIFVECDVCGNSQRFKYYYGGAEWLATVDSSDSNGERRVRTQTTHTEIHQRLRRRLPKR